MAMSAHWSILRSAQLSRRSSASLDSPFSYVAAPERERSRLSSMAWASCSSQIPDTAVRSRAHSSYSGSCIIAATSADGDQLSSLSRPWDPFSTPAPLEALSNTLSVTKMLGRRTTSSGFETSCMVKPAWPSSLVSVQLPEQAI